MSTSVFNTKSSSSSLWWACKFCAIDRALLGLCGWFCVISFSFGYVYQQSNESEFYIVSIISQGQGLQSHGPHLNHTKGNNKGVTDRKIDRQLEIFKSTQTLSFWVITFLTHHAPSIWQRDKNVPVYQTLSDVNCMHNYAFHMKCFSPKMRQPTTGWKKKKCHSSCWWIAQKLR